MFPPYGTLFGQKFISLDCTNIKVPDGIVESDYSIEDPYHVLLLPQKSMDAKTVYKYGKLEQYSKDGESEEWELNRVTRYDYNYGGNILKTWDDYENYNIENNYSLYFYDNLDRNNKIEHYWDNGIEGVCMNAYHIIEYLDDFPDVEGSVIYYTKSFDWDFSSNNWSYAWEIFNGQKKDYTLSKKLDNHYEKKVDYVYNSITSQWDVSGYKYDYVVNSKGLILEELVYKATSEEENKWPLILHIKNLINDDGIVFQSERIHYQNSTNYIERWSNIKWDKHNGNIPISGYAVQGANRIKSAKIEYLLLSDPNIEYSPSLFFSSEYENSESFHYLVQDSLGNILIDNSYYHDGNCTIQEIWQNNDYQMQYYDIDDHNWVTYDHYIHKQFYEGDNVVTIEDRHRYTHNEYYLDTNELTVSENYEYDALTDSEPYGRSRSVFSEYKAFSADINPLEDDSKIEEPKYYNLQGILVHNPQYGQILIRKVANRTDKIIFK